MLAMEWNLMLGLVFVVHSKSDQCSVLPFFGVDTAMAAGKPKSILPKAILARANSQRRYLQEKSRVFKNGKSRPTANTKQ